MRRRISASASLLRSFSSTFSPSSSTVPWFIFISKRTGVISLRNMKISLRDKKISPWDIILFLRDKKNISVGYENTELYHVVQERAEGPKAPSPIVKRVGYKKALQEVACCCSLAGDFYLVIGLTCEAFCLIDGYCWVLISLSSFTHCSTDGSKLTGVKTGFPFAV